MLMRAVPHVAAFGVALLLVALWRGHAVAAERADRLATAIAHGREGQLTRAVGELQRLRAEFPDDTAIERRLALDAGLRRLLDASRQGRPRDVLSRLQALEETHAAAEEPWLHLLRARAHEQLRQVFDAQASFQQAWERSPQTPFWRDATRQNPEGSSP